MGRLSRIEETKRAYREAETPPAPPHLSRRMKEFWASTFSSKKLQPHQVLILTKALEAYDRAEQARRLLKKNGLTFDDRFGQPRSRPEVAVERDNKALFAKLLQQIHLHDPFWETARD